MAAYQATALSGVPLAPLVWKTPQQRILELFELMGIYFQVRPKRSHGPS
jgi:hypothetical protein